MKHVFYLITICLFLYGCSGQKTNKVDPLQKVMTGVVVGHLKAANSSNTITKVPCTLSDGTQTECYQIVTNSTPVDHKMGPWCPTNISDGQDAGGIWLSDGKVHDVDGAFVKNMSDFYKDTNWKMYDGDGNIYVTKTEEDCVNAANPNVGEEYKNFCVECLPSYITKLSKTFLIPVTPKFISEPIFFMGRGGGPNSGKKPPGDRPPRGEKPPKGDRPERGGRPDNGGVPATRGVALNGVEFSAPAPVNNILDAYTLAPFDDAGGHINVHQGYHYHTATGVSYSVAQKDGHAPLIGYAIDGHGIYGRLDTEGKETKDLDACRGHFDDVRGYHYHVDHAGNNNFINCIHGAYAK